MKKKMVKKLVLAKETVRDLEELANARGGYSLGCPSVGLCPNKPTTALGSGGDC